MTPTVPLPNTMVIIGLVLLTAETQAERGMSLPVVPSTAGTSTTRTAVYALPFQLRLHSSQSNNQELNPDFGYS